MKSLFDTTTFVENTDDRELAFEASSFFTSSLLNPANLLAPYTLVLNLDYPSPSPSFYKPYLPFFLLIYTFIFLFYSFNILKGIRWFSLIIVSFNAIDQKRSSVMSR